jgi:DeoR family glycerol-3-phosphate regulon repressor
MKHFRILATFLLHFVVFINLCAELCGFFDFLDADLSQTHKLKHMDSIKTSKRHVAILDFIAERGSATVNELAAHLAVSGETIRRDATLLQERGTVLKLHGVLALASRIGEAPFEKRMRENALGKRALAKAAAAHVKDGDSLMIDTGATTSIFAQELRAKRALTIVTNSSDIARMLAMVNGNTVYMAGGALKGDNGAALGASAVEFFSRFRVRHAFISITGLSAEDGPMDADLAEAEIARVTLSRAEHRVILADSMKFGRSALVRVCQFEELDRLITDQWPEGALRERLEQAGTIIQVAIP